MHIAFLGTGLAANIHTKALRAVAPATRRSYASRTPERAAAAQARLGGAGRFDSYEAAVASPDVDTVLIGLPPSLHLEWTLRALEAGKHVIVEKPPFLTSDDVARVEQAAAGAGRQVLVAENYFYKPLAGLLRRVIASGDLGEVRFIQLTALKRQTTGDWRDDPAISGGGALFEGGIHWVCLLANIGLTPGRIRAARPGPGTEPERNVLVTIEYDEGAVASLAYSWDLPSLVNGVRFSRVYGTEGTLRFETNGVLAVQTGHRSRVFIPGLVDLAGYRAMHRDFADAIAKNRPAAYDLRLAHRDLRLIEDAYRSAAP